MFYLALFFFVPFHCSKVEFVISIFQDGKGVLLQNKEFSVRLIFKVKLFIYFVLHEWRFPVFGTGYQPIKQTHLTGCRSLLSNPENCHCTFPTLPFGFFRKQVKYVFSLQCKQECAGQQLGSRMQRLLMCRLKTNRNATTCKCSSALAKAAVRRKKLIFISADIKNFSCIFNISYTRFMGQIS